MPLHNTKQHPRYGWIYREVINGKHWTVPDAMMPFVDVAKQIRQARRNNGVECGMAEAVKALGDYTCNRIDHDPRWCEGRPGEMSQVEGEVRRATGCAGCGKRRRK